MEVTAFPYILHFTITSDKTFSSTNGRIPSWIMMISSDLQIFSKAKTPFRIDSCPDVPPLIIHFSLSMPFCFAYALRISCQPSMHTTKIQSTFGCFWNASNVYIISGTACKYNCCIHIENHPYLKLFFVSLI